MRVSFPQVPRVRWCSPRAPPAPAEMAGNAGNLRTTRASPASAPWAGKVRLARTQEGLGREVRTSVGHRQLPGRLDESLERGPDWRSSGVSNRPRSALPNSSSCDLRSKSGEKGWSWGHGGQLLGVGRGPRIQAGPPSKGLEGWGAAGDRPTGPSRPAGQTCEVDINECVKSPCRHGASCQNTQGGYRCHCQAGYSGHNCETDIDDCRPTPPGSSQASVSLGGVGAHGAGHKRPGRSEHGWKSQARCGGGAEGWPGWFRRAPELAAQLLAPRPSPLFPARWRRSHGNSSHGSSLSRGWPGLHPNLGLIRPCFGAGLSGLPALLHRG
ncbi:hypothetical protein P7K49_002095 [Saguinus oedipus]|uniref:EGF-like domain-containing protein n=1 Tax=Saguinus oedipus TaxID=9490 RepID=A0ABQ9WGE8_SAGOE|nr:hypothetical protein P7K49_002095 [Saguinus oedipus]